MTPASLRVTKSRLERELHLKNRVVDYAIKDRDATQKKLTDIESMINAIKK